MRGSSTMHTRFIALISLLLAGSASAELIVQPVKAELSGAEPKADYWQKAPELVVPLLAQPMIAPRPAETTTPSVTVQAVHDGQRIAFRLRWQDKERSEAGRLGEFSDALALQFPVKSNESPPAVMMGSMGDPVHIFHWRAQYQRDAEHGKPQMKDLYPNLTVDMYPMEFADPGAVKHLTDADRERFSPGRAEGNPQAYAKSGVDEIVAEGFGTSSVQQTHGTVGRAVWQDGEWTLVISRPLEIEGGSVLQVGGKSFVAFAVWQGGAGEVGARKCVTMMWTPLSVVPLVAGGGK
jgi:hypothetical protein